MISGKGKRQHPAWDIAGSSPSFRSVGWLHEGPASTTRGSEHMETLFRSWNLAPTAGGVPGSVLGGRTPEGTVGEGVVLWCDGAMSPRGKVRAGRLAGRDTAWAVPAVRPVEVHRHKVVWRVQGERRQWVWRGSGTRQWLFFVPNFNLTAALLRRMLIPINAGKYHGGEKCTVWGPAGHRVINTLMVSPNPTLELPQGAGNPDAAMAAR